MDGASKLKRKEKSLCYDLEEHRQTSSQEEEVSECAKQAANYEVCCMQSKQAAAKVAAMCAQTAQCNRYIESSTQTQGVLLSVN